MKLPDWLTQERADQIVDVVSVVLISLAAVFSALCGYQSGEWNDREALSYNQASSLRAQAGAAIDTATTLESVDVGLFVRYIEAVYDKQTPLAEFLRARFRPEARPAIDAWLVMHPLHNPHAPPSPFALPEYRLHTFSAADALSRQASESFASAQRAGRTAIDYLLLTVIFATVSFLAGISTKLRHPQHLAVVILGCIALLYGVVRLSALHLIFGPG